MAAAARSLRRFVLGATIMLAVSPFPSSSFAEEDVEPFEVRVTDSCEIDEALWVDGQLYLLLKNAYRLDVGMVVYVEGDKLYHWRGPLDLSSICGIGRDSIGRFVYVTRCYPPGVERLHFIAGTQIRGSSGASLGGFRVGSEETVVAFPPSRPGMFITNCRIGTFGIASRGLSSLSFKNRLTRFSGAADASDDTVLVGTSSSREAGSKEDTAGLWWIDALSGDVRPARLRVTTTRPEDSSSGPIEAIHPRSDMLAGVLADPSKPGWFYVAVGDLYRGGRLLHVGPEDQCEIVFRRETGPFGHIAGTPAPRNPFLTMFHEEGVLAVACDSRGCVHFVTPRGVYRLGEAGPVFLGVPAFGKTGGFYIARNMPGFLVVLSYQEPLIYSSPRVHLVPVPTARTTQPASGPEGRRE